MVVVDITSDQLAEIQSLQAAAQAAAAASVAAQQALMDYVCQLGGSGSPFTPFPQGPLTRFQVSADGTMLVLQP